MLYTEDLLREDFKDLEIETMESLETYLSEGDFHNGKANVIRILATKQ
ncbi:hypothetical protein [Marivirga tractuosa]|nr:hypothetical protein [Marivirga tractuosa]